MKKQTPGPAAPVRKIYESILKHTYGGEERDMTVQFTSDGTDIYLDDFYSLKGSTIVADHFNTMLFNVGTFRNEIIKKLLKEVADGSAKELTY